MTPAQFGKTSTAQIAKTDPQHLANPSRFTTKPNGKSSRKKRGTLHHCLDLLQGSLHKNPSQRGYHLTTKVQQKTVTQYVRQELVPKVRAMTAHHLKVRKLLGRLSQTNWRLLQLPPDD